MSKKPGSLLILFAVLVLITAACASASGDSVGAEVPASDSVVQVDGDHPEEADDHVDEVANIEPSGDADRVVEVELTEFEIAAHSFEFTPGETIEFIITNSGVVEHEFRLSNQGRVDDHIAGGHADHNDDAMTDEEMAEMDHAEGEMSEEEMAEMGGEEVHEDDGHALAEEVGHEAEEAHEIDDAVLVLGPGETGTLVFTFPENDHDFTAAVCLIPGHHEAGMAEDLHYAA
jgi:uncharacterized cupredoxin-like copper-binding protein